MVVEPPRGIYPARVDDKGRVKLPAAFHQYLARLGERVFVTSLDIRTVRIYPHSVWKENERLFEQAMEETEVAEDLSFLANDYGADSDIDAQGRVLIPTGLRRDLGIENQPVWVDYFKGHINVFGKQIYDERKTRALDGLRDKLRLMEKKGLK